MDLLTPEALGGAGVTIGGIGLIAFVRFVFQLGGLSKAISKFLDNVTSTLDRQREHFEKEERHHERVEATLTSIDVALRAGNPRPVSGEHTPVRGVEVSPHPPASQ